MNTEQSYTLSLTPYTVTVQKKEVKYDIAGSIKNILFWPQWGLDAKNLIAHDEIMNKIESSTDDTVTLTKDEYDRIRQLIENYKGYTVHDVEFVKRILQLSETGDK